MDYIQLYVNLSKLVTSIIILGVQEMKRPYAMYLCLLTVLRVQDMGQVNIL